MKTVLSRLAFGLILLTACSKQPIDPKSDRYFWGDWKLSAGTGTFLSTNPVPTTVSFQESGKVIFDTHYVLSPSQGTYKLIQDWTYKQASQELILNQGQDIYHLENQLPTQFTVTHRASGKALTFSKL